MLGCMCLQDKKNKLTVLLRERYRLASPCMPLYFTGSNRFQCIYGCMSARDLQEVSINRRFPKKETQWLLKAQGIPGAPRLGCVNESNN